MDEKRKSQRHSHRDVTYISDGTEMHRGSMLNISLSGIRFVTDREINKRAVLDVNINYSPINFILKAQIIWCRIQSSGKYEHGAQFINVPKDRIILLEEHIQDIERSDTQ